jgi:hypothetical protein
VDALIGNELEQSIIGLYAKDLSAGFTILQIAKLLGKAYPYINRKVNDFITEGIFTKTVVGKSHLCRIDPHNPKAIVLLTIHWLRAIESRKINEPSFESLLSEISTLRLSHNALAAIETEEGIIIVGNESEIPAGILLSSMRIKFVEPQTASATLRDIKVKFVLMGFEYYYSTVVV